MTRISDEIGGEAAAITRAARARRDELPGGLYDVGASATSAATRRGRRRRGGAA